MTLGEKNEHGEPVHWLVSWYSGPDQGTYVVGREGDWHYERYRRNAAAAQRAHELEKAGATQVHCRWHYGGAPAGEDYRDVPKRVQKPRTPRETAQQRKLLAALAAHPGATQWKLGEVLGLDVRKLGSTCTASIFDMLERLERQGKVRRVRDHPRERGGLPRNRWYAALDAEQAVAWAMAFKLLGPKLWDQQSTNEEPVK